ncbi:hypothetical protein CAPTEDRAFT_199932 [Capitella teleta]|uniref:Uncharacterized protein n=1 Tax=Capitella teleta TaxID=283909 RepID=R7ULA4_CAPTE|nr:hypothetical protein CAPTEDRAFT_199932 [Capitella teleta]|eukprot:ELU04027.1 hypothetical protein CAPTEDRAFT_199932 [Capitella teleta]
MKSAPQHTQDSNQERRMEKTRERTQQRRDVRAICQRPAWGKFLKTDKTPSSATRSNRRKLLKHRKLSREQAAPSSSQVGKSTKHNSTNETEFAQTSLKIVNGIRIEPLTEEEVQAIRTIKSKGDRMAELKLPLPGCNSISEDSLSVQNSNRRRAEMKKSLNEGLKLWDKFVARKLYMNCNAYTIKT